MTFSQIEGRLPEATAEIDLGEPGAQGKLRGAEQTVGKARVAAKKAEEQLDTQSAAVELLAAHLLRLRAKDLQDLRLGCAQRLLENQTQFGALDRKSVV